MWPATKPTPEKIRGHKRVAVCGSKFVIRKINPLIDFEPDRMPQIFTSFVSQRPSEASSKFNEGAYRKMQKDVMEIVAVGVVEPKLSKNPDDGITAEDLFRNPDMGYKLFMEIMSHSMNYFSGLKGVFFYLKTRLFLFIHWRSNMDVVRRTWLLKEGT